MWLYDTGAAAVVLAYSDGAGHEAVATVTLFEATTTDATAQQQAFTGSPQVTPCLQALVVSDAPRYPWLGSPAASKVTSSSDPVALQEPGDSELFTMTVRANGSGQSALWAFTHEYVGRYEVATEVTWCTCNALPPATLQHLVDVAGAHVAALAAKHP
jgi:hypothetical protein